MDFQTRLVDAWNDEMETDDPQWQPLKETPKKKTLSGGIYSGTKDYSTARCIYNLQMYSINNSKKDHLNSSIQLMLQRVSPNSKQNDTL